MTDIGWVHPIRLFDEWGMTINFSELDSSAATDQGDGCGKKLALLLFVAPVIILAPCIVEIFGKWF